MKKLIAILSLALAFILPAGVRAQSAVDKEYVEAVREYMDVTNSRETMVTSLVQTYKTMGLPISNVEAMTEEIADAIWDDNIEVTAKVMQEYFTLDELKEIINFNKTAVGQKLARYQPEVVLRAQQALTEKCLGTIQNILMKYINN